MARLPRVLLRLETPQAQQTKVSHEESDFSSGEGLLRFYVRYGPA